MPTDQLNRCLESLDQSQTLLTAWALRDLDRGWRNLTALADNLSVDSLRELCAPLGRILPRCPDPDMALNNLERFAANPAGAAQVPALLESRARSLETLLQMFSTSQWCSDLLVANPEFTDMLRVPLRRSPSREEMLTQLQGEVDGAFEDSAVLRAFRRFRQRQLLRIGTNDVIRDRPLEEITRDISRVAEVSLEVALQTALRTLSARFGQPFTDSGRPARVVILAFGKLGGEELNYSSDIDLMAVYDEDGEARGRRASAVANEEFFSRVVREVIRLLSSHTVNGSAYRVDLRLRPEGEGSPAARSLASSLSYYDTLGRTWERQALIKARPVAGDLRLGEQFLKAIEGFVYRKYLGFAEINEIKAIKRRIEHKALRAGTTETEVKTGHGGIRDIEFTIQFLQLLNGGDLAELRQRNTLLAMQSLAKTGCLTATECHILEDAYRFLRKTEHRLQLLFDLQTHRLPDSPEELRKLALRMGYVEERLDQALEDFLKDYRDKTDLNRKILDHLLHDTFHGEDGQASPEADLILDPEPEAETKREVLSRYGFRDVEGAYRNLTQLAEESVRFLSTRRCRHFLASIAPGLLRALAETPDPDMALVNLENVTASLGAKTVLWELFSFNPPSLKLYVELCSGSPFLSDILINNPGMIDELLDSLVLNRPRTQEELRAELADLCKGATDPDPILHSFRDKELLRIGVQDLLGKAPIQETTAALSDLAEVILAEIATLQTPPLLKRFGVPVLDQGERAGQPCRYVLLALGKLGGRELGYYSDLDLVLVYEGDGPTTPPPGARRFDRFELTSNSHFFAELAQRVIRTAGHLGPMGRLYQIDMRLRPTGGSGSLVTPLDEFRRYYTQGAAQLWEWQALTRARVVHGDTDFAPGVMQALAEMAAGLAWRPELVDGILSMRWRLEASRSERDLKRGFGGLVDVEFLVQMLQLAHARTRPQIRCTNTWEGLAALRDSGLLTSEEYEVLRDSYTFLRHVESRLRVLHNRAMDEVPENPAELDKLARHLGFDVGTEISPSDQFLRQIEEHTRRTRELFLRLTERENQDTTAERPQ